MGDTAGLENPFPAPRWNVPIFDGHLDLAWNALGYGRDQTLPLAEIRMREMPTTSENGRGAAAGLARGRDSGPASTPGTTPAPAPAPGIGPGTATVCLPELRRAGVAMVHATIFQRTGNRKGPREMLLRADPDFASPALTHAAACGQLAYYQLLERRGEVVCLNSAPAVAEHWRQWQAGAADLVGIILLMECADAISDVEELDWWRRRGLCGLSLSHVQRSTYAAGNDCPESDGGLTDAGRQLLVRMAELGLALDLSHLSDRSFEEAEDRFEGWVYASHCNCRRLVPGPRQLTDRQIGRIGARGGVVGVVLCNFMLSTSEAKPPARDLISLRHVAEHIDHICQVTGSIEHVGVGSDLDGGFGREHVPREVESIAGLRLLPEWLNKRGFTDRDIRRILGENWVSFWIRCLEGPGELTSPGGDDISNQAD
ncbi:MAG: membrane dipeptidase [Phycisphaeraceae bacterium]|nr:membrane dipeptidase [Phycisphaeraceae bacterium]